MFIRNFSVPDSQQFIDTIQLIWLYCFVHPIFSSFRFWFLVTFGNKVTKYYIIFVHIFQGKRGKMEKIWKENHATKVTKIQKPKDENLG